jgi:hypothetical protein
LSDLAVSPNGTEDATVLVLATDTRVVNQGSYAFRLNASSGGILAMAAIQ